MRTGTTDALPRQERTEAAHRQRGLASIIPKGEGLARQVLHQLEAPRVLQFVVDVRQCEVCLGIAHRAAFQADDREARIGEFFRQDRAGNADTDDDDIHWLEFGSGHAQLLPLLAADISCTGWPCASTFTR